MTPRFRLQEISQRPEGMASGHGLCAGCAEPVAVREVLSVLENPAVVSLATGCLEVSSTKFPETSWHVPLIHSAFENAATTASGVEAAYRALVRRGRIRERPVTFAAFGGYGSTSDVAP